MTCHWVVYVVIGTTKSSTSAYRVGFSIMGCQMSVKWKRLIPGEDFAAYFALHAHVLSRMPGPMDDNVEAVLDEAGESLVALPAVVRLFPPLQVQLRVVALEGGLALQVDVALGAVVLVLRLGFVLLRHVALVRLPVLEGDAAVRALVFHLRILTHLLLRPNLLVLTPAGRHVVLECVVPVKTYLTCKLKRHFVNMSSGFFCATFLKDFNRVSDT